MSGTPETPSSLWERDELARVIHESDPYGLIASGAEPHWDEALPGTKAAVYIRVDAVLNSNWFSRIQAQIPTKPLRPSPRGRW